MAEVTEAEEITSVTPLLVEWFGEEAGTRQSQKKRRAELRNRSSKSIDGRLRHRKAPDA